MPDTEGFGDIDPVLAKQEYLKKKLLEEKAELAAGQARLERRRINEKLYGKAKAAEIYKQELRALAEQEDLRKMRANGWTREQLQQDKDRQQKARDEAEAENKEYFRLRDIEAARKKQVADQLRQEQIREQEASQSESVDPATSQPMCSSKMISPNRSYNECIATCSGNSCGQPACRSECFDAAIQYNQSPCQPTACN